MQWRGLHCSIPCWNQGLLLKEESLFWFFFWEFNSCCLGGEGFGVGSSVGRVGQQHICLWHSAFGRCLGFVDLADLSLCPRGISEHYGFLVHWPFACLYENQSRPDPESWMQKWSIVMVIGQQHCLALGVLVPKEINAFRKQVGGLAPVASLSAGGGFSLWSKGCSRLSLPCPIPGEWLWSFWSPSQW